MADKIFHVNVKEEEDRGFAMGLKRFQPHHWKESRLKSHRGINFFCCGFSGIFLSEDKKWLFFFSEFHIKNKLRN